MKIQKILSLVMAIAMLITSLPAVSLKPNAENISTEPADIAVVPVEETEDLTIPETTDESASQTEKPKATKATATSGTVGDCTWQLSGSVLTISGNGDMGDRGGFYIPWKNLTGSIYSVVIEEGVTGIGSYAFSGCSNLTSVAIPDSVTRIGSRAFDSCSSLTSITIPDSVTSIGNYAFYDCSSLSRITVGTGVKEIGGEAFTRCTMYMKVHITDIQSWCEIDFANQNANPLMYLGELYLNGKLVTEINLPEGTEKIGDYALYNYRSLTTITIPDSVINVGRNALLTSTLSYNMYDGGKYLGNSNNPYMVLVDIAETNITSFQIHPNTKIISSAFRNCEKLTSITIPNNVINIDREAFDGCTSLTSITIPDSVISIGEDAFYGCHSMTSVTMGDGIASIGDGAFATCISLAHLTIGDNVTSIGKLAFVQCSSLTSITIPDSVTSIGDSAFGSCIKLKNATIGDGVTCISFGAFSGCGLTNITIPDTVTSIGSYAFQDCSSLTSINIPDSVTSIGGCAFQRCSSLANIIIPDSVTSIGESVFYGCSSLTNITIPDSVSSIGSKSFYDCNNLTSVIIGNGVTGISKDAFYGCGSLESITIPFVGSKQRTSTNTYQYPFGYIFGTSSYTGADAVTQKYHGSSTSSTTSATYYIPTSLKSVTVNGGNLLYGAFYNCTNLTTITIGKDVLSINKAAFTGCTGLERIEVDQENPNYCSVNGILYNKDKTEIIWAPANQKLKLQVNYLYASGDKASDSVVETLKAGEAYSVEIPEIPGYSTKENSVTGTMPAEDTIIDVIYYENAKQSSGQCNGSISWSLYEDGMLVLRGSGAMPDYTSGGAPWAADADKVTAVYLDPRITSIGDYAFQNCGAATYVDYGYSITSIGKYAFSGCTSVASLPLPESVKTIDEGAFYGCSSLSNVVIPNTVTTVGAKAFQGCAGIVKVTVGTGTTQIGENAFADCTGLTQVYFRGAPAELGADALGSTDGKYVYYYTTVSGWNEAVTDGLWYGYTAVPYNMISENGFDGTNFFIVKVVDRYNEVVENAKVVFGAKTMHTNEDGMAYFVYSQAAQKLGVSASGFVAFTDESYTAANTGYMEIIALSDNPSMVAGISFNGESIATSTVRLNCNEDKQVKIVVSGYCPRTIIRYELFQGNRLLSTVKTDAQTAQFTVNAKDFEEGETVQVRMYISDGSYVATALNVHVLHIANFSEEEFLSGMEKVNINLPVVGNIPFDLTINNPLFTNVIIEDDTIKIGINMDLTDAENYTNIKKAADEAKKVAAKKVLKNTSGFEAEISGYVEIKYLGNNQYEIVKSQVSLVVGARLSFKAQASWFGIVGVYFKASLTSTGELTLVFADYEMDEGFKFEDLSLKVENKLRLEGGAYLLWGLGKAGIYGQGTLGFELGIAPDFEVDHVYVIGEAGVTWSVFWGAIKGKKVFWDDVLYEWPSKKALRTISTEEELQAALQDPENYSVNDRAYLSERSEWLGGSVPAKKNPANYDGTLQSNVYYNIAPKIVSCGDTVMMVWLDDNAKRSRGNYQTLYYALFDQEKESWSAPIQVDSNGTFDCEFDVCTDGKNIYILYTEKTALQADMEDVDVTDSQQVAQMIGNVEIKVCVYNGSGFSLSAVLTDNEECEILPSLQFADGVLTATWATMEPIGIDQTSSGGNNIFCAQLIDGVWSQQKRQAGNANQVYALSSGTLEGKNYTAYIVDADGNGNTTDDYALLLVDENGNRKQLSTGKLGAVQFVTVDGVELLMWSDNSNIYYVASASDTPSSLLTEQIVTNGAFTCTALENGKILISFIGAAENEDGTDVFGICFNGKTVEGGIFRITKTSGFVDSYDIGLTEDGFVVSYIETSAQVDGEKINTTADFKYAVLSYDAKITIADVEYDISRITAGGEFSAVLHLQNSAMVSANGVTVELRSNSGELISSAVNGTKLLPGTTQEVTVTLTAPQTITPEACILVVKATGDDGAGGSFELPIGYANLGITGEQKIIGGKNYILYTVTNSGNIGAATALSIRKNGETGEEIASTAGMYVATGDTAIYTFDASDVAKKDLVYARVDTDVYEPYELDNAVTMNLLHIDTQVYLYTPSEMVESPKLSVTSAEYDKYTDDSIIVTIEVGEDSFAGIQGLKKGTDYTVSGSKVTISKSYLQGLPAGISTLVFNFDYQQESMVTRSMTVTVSDSTPITVTGQVTIDGDGTVGSTLTANHSGLQPHGAAYDYAWSIDGKVVSSESSYTVAVGDYGKTITLAVTAKNGYTGTFTAAVVADYRTQKAPVAPVAAWVTDTVIQLIAVDGIEYSMDLQQWQSEGWFRDLVPNTQYTFYARMKATETSYASPASTGIKITTPKTTPIQPAAPQLLERTIDSITLVSDPSMEYRIEGGSWTGSNVFTGLAPNTAYVFYQRYKETNTAYASEASTASFKTEDRTPIGGTVTIEGKPYFGTALTAVLKDFTGDAQSISYQWYRDGVAIDGAVDSTYTVTKDDMGKTLEIRVAGTGAYQGELTAQLVIPAYIPGDVNGDGYVNSNDVLYFLRYTLSPGRYPINQSGDMNGDGYVNSNDVIYLLRHMLSPGRYPLYG